MKLIVNYTEKTSPVDCTASCGHSIRQGETLVTVRNNEGRVLDSLCRECRIARIAVIRS